MALCEPAAFTRGPMHPAADKLPQSMCEARGSLRVGGAFCVGTKALRWPRDQAAAAVIHYRAVPRTRPSRPADDKEGHPASSLAAKETKERGAEATKGKGPCARPSVLALVQSTAGGLSTQKIPCCADLMLC